MLENMKDINDKISILIDKVTAQQENIKALDAKCEAISSAHNFISWLIISTTPEKIPTITDAITEFLGQSEKMDNNDYETFLRSLLKYFGKSLKDSQAYPHLRFVKPGPEGPEFLDDEPPL